MRRVDDNLHKALRHIIESRPKGYMPPEYSVMLFECISIAFNIIDTCKEQLKDFGYIMRQKTSNLEKTDEKD
jgi:hypothetical protein